MTQAQKTAKEKFKKAIAYRQKTGVSLKEAFAHVYGKKVGAIKKAPAKKVAIKKKAVKKVSRPSRSTKKVKATYKVNYQTGTSNRTTRGKNQDSKRKALAPGKRTSASGNTYYETRANRSDFSRKAMTGIKKYNWEELDNLRLTRVNNDTNGNPRYVLHFLDVLNNEENSFLPFSKKYEYALKKAKKIGGRKFHNKQFGGGIVFQSYNTDNLKEQIIDLRETTPKIKY